MKAEFGECLEKGKIRQFSSGKSLVGKELETAANDLLSSQKSFLEQNYKWSTIQAYYSMFHSARALLYAKGYRERSHHCLIVALRSLYVEEKLLALKYVENLQKAKIL